MIGRRRKWLWPTSGSLVDLPYEAPEQSQTITEQKEERKNASQVKRCRPGVEPANVADDLLDAREETPRLRHVTELPVMGFDAEFRSGSGVAVMIGSNLTEAGPVLMPAACAPWQAEQWALNFASPACNSAGTVPPPAAGFG
jgi:hypothetical protein